MVLRLLALLFLCSYPLVLLVRTILLLAAPGSGGLYPLYTFSSSLVLQSSVGVFLWDATWATGLCCVVGALFGGLFSMRFAIVASMATGIGSGIIVQTQNDTFVGIVFGITYGWMLGLTFNSAGALRRASMWSITIASLVGIMVGLLIGTLTGTVLGYWAGVAVVQIFPFGFDLEGSIAGIFAGSFAGSSIVWIMGMIVRSVFRSRGEAVEVATRLGIVVAAAFGVAVGVPVGDAGSNVSGFMAGAAAGYAQGLIVGAAFLASYVVGYYRLPLYPGDAFSMLNTFFASRAHTSRVFDYLRQCSLHWNESIFLPLPYLKRMLQIAAGQDVEQTLAEISFIVQERPQQRWAALAATYEIALNELGRATTLDIIGQAYRRLRVILTPEIRELNPHMALLFGHLEDASQEVAGYAMLSTRDQQAALNQMSAHLAQIHPNTAFRDVRLNRLLERVVKQWQIPLGQELATLKQALENLNRIENPYTAGPALALYSPLFVGRQDVARKLGEALRRPDRPTFFLNGERRMGKSSILKHLPVLLGPRYLPIFCDLQATGITSSASAFFQFMAHAVYEALKGRYMAVKELERGHLEAAQRENEAAVYHRFEVWLQGVERVLEQQDRVLLLTFDEFEELDDAGRRGYIDLKLLLSWFRSVIQNHSRLALLFSGAKTVNDMGVLWTGYFVNVEMIWVSFLPPQDAQRLIAQPVPTFSGEEIFGELVIAEIMRVTYGHPFLIQALCKQLVEDLNFSSRRRAQVQDVAAAIEEILQTWSVYFWNLWDRADPLAQICLLAVLALAEDARVSQLAQRTGLDVQSMQLTLEKLCKRDILRQQDDTYRFAVPIFQEWLARNLYLLAPASRS